MAEKGFDELYPMLFKELAKAIAEMESLGVDAPEAEEILKMLKEAQKSAEDMRVNGLGGEEE